MNSFIKKLVEEPVVQEPWPYQTIDNAIGPSLFEKINQQCQPLLNLKLDNLLQIYSDDFQKYNLDFNKELNIISEELLANHKKITKNYPYNRNGLQRTSDWYLGVTPPLPHRSSIHQESLSKILSVVVYVAPCQNTGTLMYKTQSNNDYVKTIPWKPNNAFAFCGKENTTWHSYQSDILSNRVTLNFFVRRSINLPNWNIL
jgi:hypothetical protein